MSTQIRREWRIQTKSVEGAPLDNTDYFNGTPMEAYARAYELTRRASWMSNTGYPPNRRVYCRIDGMSSKPGVGWVKVFEKWTRLRDKAASG